MKNKLFGEDLLVLQNTRGNICISVVVPMHPTSPGRRLDKPGVENAIDKAKQLLQYKYPRRDIKRLLQSLDDQLEKIDFVHNVEGLGIYISSDVNLLVKFPFPVEEKIIVDDNFEIRDLVYKLNYARPYFVLMLTEKMAKFFEGSWDHLAEIREAHWPFKYEEEYVYSRSARSSSFAGHAHVKMFEKDKSESEAIRYTSFFRQVDNGLNDYLKKDTSLVLLATERVSSLFEKISRHKMNIIHKVHGSYSRDNLKSISDIIWPVVYQHVHDELSQLIREFEEMIGAHRAVNGVQDVWNAAKEGNAFKLLVEKDYRCPGFITKDNDNLYLRPPKGAHKILPDAVDDLIITVLQKNGKVYFTDNGLLRDYGRIALITRF